MKKKKDGLNAIIENLDQTIKTMENLVMNFQITSPPSEPFYFKKKKRKEKKR